MLRKALVTVVLGEAYQRFYEARIRPGHERLARRLGCPLFVFTRPLYTSSRVHHAHASWEKVKLFEEPELAGFDALCWLDADLFVRGDPPDPFALAGDGWLAVDDDSYGVPGQRELGLRWWYGFAPETAWPPRLLNSGLFVAHRQSRAVFRGVFDAYGGRWDQGPLSYHWMAEPHGTIGPIALNRLVIHHLAAHGYGPTSMRTMVEADSLLHFAAASALSTPDYLAWAERAEEGRQASPALHLRAHLRTLRFALERPARARLEGTLAAHPQVAEQLASRLHVDSKRLSALLSGVAPWQRQALRKALAMQPRLLLSRAQDAYPGWVTADVVTPELPGNPKRKFGAAPQAMIVRLDPLDAVLACAPHSLASIRVLGVLESLPAHDQVRFLRACAQACPRDAVLLVAHASLDHEAPTPSFAEQLARRFAMTRAEIEACVREAGLRADIDSTDGDDIVVDFGIDAPLHLVPPRAHHRVRLYPR